LREAIACRRAVHVESLVGHPWAANASLLGARIFSLACLPLFVSGRCFGCVYLYTRTPGRSIQRERLDDLAVLATQAALLLASESRAGRSKAKTMEPDRLSFGEGPMRALEDRLAKLAPSDLNLLVLGETGSGKELVARAIHGRSRRAAGPFIAVNCGAIPPTLIESVLFGYQKGAFTGADRDTKGKFAAADGGTLFLDEIGDLPLELQVKLLRVIQERQIEPLGALKPISVDLRVVSATHRDIKALVREGKFREDLFFRLAGAALEVPSLRERPDDILPLAKTFLERTGSGFTLSSGASERLLAHSWPGNVRELEQVVARAAALASGMTIEARDLELHDAQPTVAGELRHARGAHSLEMVQRALARMGGSRSRAAAALGISERTLYRILASDGSGSAV
jgi:two-component system, NtrC family, response regulator